MYKLSDSQISTSMAGESVILDHKKGEYFTLNEVGSVVWGVFQNQASDIDDLVKAVQEEYDIDTETCKTDVQALIDELLNKKLIERI